jgi:hypothetical protein
VVIAAERCGARVAQLIEKTVKATGDQEAVLSAIGLTELIDGIDRAQTPEICLRRESFLNELGRLDGLSVHESSNTPGGISTRKPECNITVRATTIQAKVVFLVRTESPSTSMAGSPSRCLL